MASKLYIGNLSFDTTETALRDAFTPFGTVTDIFVASDQFTGRARGFAFVTFAAEAESKVAIEKMNGVEFEGRPLTVSEARPKESPSPRSRSFGPDRRAGAFYTRNNRRR
ncbi:MAG: hypothetical protein A3G75_14995 [Verrucomicrobia bacterium RIFCSPLOWO2_12_FULL_64_8]|nr:MAG: hypothetical protein A3G75_14995 [Verrucomicrobia bacterium RIFCSPLOWO2_12_FULL_64_8]